MKSRLHKPGTVETYSLHLKNYILPGLGGLGLVAIKPTTVQQWVQDLYEIKGLASRTIATIYGIFASVMQGTSVTSIFGSRRAWTSGCSISRQRSSDC